MSPLQRRFLNATVLLIDGSEITDTLSLGPGSGVIVGYLSDTFPSLADPSVNEITQTNNAVCAVVVLDGDVEFLPDVCKD